MKLLSDAVKKGFQDVKKLKQAPALAPLRQREDFRKLVGDLEAKRVCSSAMHWNGPHVPIWRGR
jgi:hypothetical protein